MTPPVQIRLATRNDIPAWRALSAEYDDYVKKLVPDLTRWYEGSDDEPSFDDYMALKIDRQEAFAAIGRGGKILGFVAISKAKNRITFFGVIHASDFEMVGQALLRHALQFLDAAQPVHLNEIACHSPKIGEYVALYRRHGFVPSGQALENGVPVNVFEKPPVI